MGQPLDLENIQVLLETQDNRITADPLFIVYQKRAVYGIEDGYDFDGITWVNEYAEEVDSEELAEAIKTGVYPEDWRGIQYKLIDEFVTCTFTEHAANVYIQSNKRNLRDPFTYVESLYGSNEMKELRKMLLKGDLVDKNNIPMDLHIFEEDGSVVDDAGAIVKTTQQQLNDVVNHAAQLIEMRRSGASEEELHGVMDELEEAMLAASVVDTAPELTPKGLKP